MDHLPPPLPIQPARTRHWWQRHWMWLVPTGCVSAIVLIAGLIWLLVAVAKFIYHLHIEQWL